MFYDRSIVEARWAVGLSARLLLVHADVRRFVVDGLDGTSIRTVADDRCAGA